MTTLIRYAGAEGAARQVSPRNDSYFKWTPDRCAELQRLWCSTQMRAAEIGAALGCKKNAVIGKARRMGLEKRKRSPSGRGEARKQRTEAHPEVTEQRRSKAAQATAAWRARKAAQAPPPERPQTKFVVGEEPHLAPSAGGVGVTLAELADDGCRYLWDGPESVLYCGQPARGRWCAEHGARMTREETRRR